MNPPDLLELKNQVATALVESIFRRAGYRVMPCASRDIPPHLGREDLPDFRAARVGVRDDAEARLVKVRYRRHVEQYLTVELRRGPRSFLAVAKQYWPALVIVFVADEPEPARSCFRVLDLASWSEAEPPALVELAAHTELNIYQLNVEEHEMLARRILGLLSIRPASLTDKAAGSWR